MLSARNVADYFLAQVNEDAGDSLSNLKLQKLVYYAQGFHLALYGRPLFPEQIRNWEHGPVVPDLYHAFKEHSAQPLPTPDALDLREYSPEVIELLDEVYSVYGQFSAWKLRCMTHEEPPWKETRRGDVIPHALMEAYFKTQLVETSQS